MVVARGRVWAEGGFLGKDEGPIVHFREPFAARARLNERVSSDANTVFFRVSSVRYAPESFVEGPMGVRGECEAVSRVVILG
jgi:hypothetical protein